MDTRLLDQVKQRLAADASRRGAVRLLTGGTVAALAGAALDDAMAKGNGQQGGGQQNGGQAKSHKNSGNAKGHHKSGKGKGGNGGNGGNRSQGNRSGNGAKTCLQPGASCTDGDRCCGQGHYCATTASTIKDKNTICCKAPGMACSNDDECCGGSGACDGGFCSSR